MPLLVGYVPSDMVIETIEEDEYAEIDPQLLENLRAQQSDPPPPSGPAPNLPAQRAAPGKCWNPCMLKPIELTSGCFVMTVLVDILKSHDIHVFT